MKCKPTQVQASCSGSLEHAESCSSDLPKLRSGQLHGLSGVQVLLHTMEGYVLFVIGLAHLQHRLLCCAQQLPPLSCSHAFSWPQVAALPSLLQHPPPRR